MGRSADGSMYCAVCQGRFDISYVGEGRVS